MENISDLSNDLGPSAAMSQLINASNDSSVIARTDVYFEASMLWQRIDNQIEEEKKIHVIDSNRQNQQIKEAYQRIAQLHNQIAHEEIKVETKQREVIKRRYNVKQLARNNNKMRIHYQSLQKELHDE